MNRYLKHPDPTILTEEFVDNLDWDIIELPIQIDSDQLKEYYNTLTKDFVDLTFSFKSKEYLKPEIYQRYMETNRIVNYVGNIDGWTISWPVERDIPCPGKKQGDPAVYPEVVGMNNMDFYYKAVPQSRYMFGILTKIWNILTENALRQLLVSRHYPNLVTLTHIDSDLKKLHIPLFTNKESIFHFGDNGEREYHMEVGKIYIINPMVPHGTYNNGSTERVHLISRIDKTFISEAAAMTGIIQ